MYHYEDINISVEGLNSFNRSVRESKRGKCYFRIFAYLAWGEGVKLIFLMNSFDIFDFNGFLTDCFKHKLYWNCTESKELVFFSEIVSESFHE